MGIERSERERGGKQRGREGGRGREGRVRERDK